MKGKMSRRNDGQFWTELGCLLSSTVFSYSSCSLQSKRKGLSVEEKRKRMMEFFFEKVYNRDSRESAMQYPGLINIKFQSFCVPASSKTR
jgi:hypothetical protein